MKNFKRLASLLAAAAMFFVLSMTAFAADGDPKITITQQGTSSISLANHTFEAYQIFSAVLDATEQETGNENGTLSQIQWGKNVILSTETTDAAKGAAFLAALKADTAIGDDFADCSTAEDVARVLEEKRTDTAFAQSFADAAAKFVTTNKDNLPPPTTGEDSTISVDGVGYYLIKDEDNSLNNIDNEAYTDFILKVLGDVQVEIKADAPTLDKKIGELTDEGTEANTAAIGDTVPFKLTSVVPDMSGYDKYFFIVEDTMTEGLTFNNDVKVYLNGTAETNVVDPSKYTVTGPDATNKFRIIFKDFYNDFQEHTGEPIYITYSATLNEKADLTQTGNENTAKLIYSNNPNNTGTGSNGVPDNENVCGKTPEKNTKTYTTQLNVEKVDASTKAKLANAWFKLEGTALKTTLVNEQIFAASATGDYYLLKDGTYTQDDPTDSTKAQYVTDDEGNYPKYALVTKVSEVTENAEVVVTGYTDANGVITFKGLNAGEYTLTELKAPDGYNILTDPIEFEITSSDVSLTGVTWGLADGSNENVSYDADNNTFKTTVENSKGILLPATGGIGTVIFYLVGSAMIAAAVIMLIAKKRRNKTAEK